MPISIKLNNMAAKLLVDYVSHSGWARGHEDVYRAGKLLSVVLPHFVSGGVPPSSPDDIVIPQVPTAPVVDERGEPNWAGMTKVEADTFRAVIREYNQSFIAWCRTILDKPIELTDKQLETCQRAIKYYAPRSDEEKQKDREKQIAPRPEIAPSEYMFLLLSELKLGAE